MNIRKQIIKAMNTNDYYHYTTFCNDVGICRFNFSKWINNKKSLSTNTLFKMLNHLKILRPKHNLTLGKNTNIEDLIYLYENQDKLQKVFEALDELENRY